MRASQRDFSEMLVQAQGTYNQNRIVLSGTSHAKANYLAEMLGGELRITKSGTFATITLPENMTMSDLAVSEEMRPYLKQFSLDYNNYTIVEDEVSLDVEEILHEHNVEKF